MKKHARLRTVLFFLISARNKPVKMASFREAIFGRYAPVVEVLATPEVVALCAAEGLTPAQLFRPAGEAGLELNGARTREF